MAKERLQSLDVAVFFKYGNAKAGTSKLHHIVYSRLPCKKIKYCKQVKHLLWKFKAYPSYTRMLLNVSQVKKKL